MKPPQKPRTSDLLNVISGLILFGVLVIAFYALSKNCAACGAACAGLKILAVSAGVALAALMVGGLLGFLFSIPRSGSQNQNAAYPDNSNLVDISDWLTKILVGAGLVTLTKIPPKLELLANWIGRNGLANDQDGPVFALALLAFFGVCGFMWVYVWTRLNFSRDLANAGSQALLLSAIKESPVASLLLRALSLPPTTTDDEAKALRNQAKFMGKSELSENPGSRKIAIQYSRLLEEQFNDRDAAIQILKDALAARRKNDVPPDADDGALNFNLAGYCNRKSKKEADAARKQELQTEAVKYLREAVKCDPGIKADIKDDADVSDLTI